MFPEGNNTKDIFKSIKELDWIITKDTEYREDNFEQHLLSTNEKLYVMIQNIINIKAASYLVLLIKCYFVRNVNII